MMSSDGSEVSICSSSSVAEGKIFVRSLKMGETASPGSEAMAEIEQTLQRFRNEELSVDELSKCVKRTSELIAACKAELRKVEEEVSEILKE